MIGKGSSTYLRELGTGSSITFDRVCVNPVKGRQYNIPFFASNCMQVYIVVNDPTFHEVAYALMVMAIAYLGFRNLG